MPVGFSVAPRGADSNMQPNESSVLHDYQGQGVPIGGTIDINTKAGHSIINGVAKPSEAARPYVPPPISSIDSKVEHANNII